MRSIASFARSQLTPTLSVQAEYRYRDSHQGDLSQQFDLRWLQRQTWTGTSTSMSDGSAYTTARTPARPSWARCSSASERRKLRRPAAVSRGRRSRPTFRSDRAAGARRRSTCTSDKLERRFRPRHLPGREPESRASIDFPVFRSIFLTEQNRRDLRTSTSTAPMATSPPPPLRSSRQRRVFRSIPSTETRSTKPG